MLAYRLNGSSNNAVIIKLCHLLRCMVESHIDSCKSLADDCLSLVLSYTEPCCFANHGLWKYLFQIESLPQSHGEQGMNTVLKKCTKGQHIIHWRKLYRGTRKHKRVILGMGIGIQQCGVGSERYEKLSSRDSVVDGRNLSREQSSDLPDTRSSFITLIFLAGWTDNAWHKSS